MKINSIIFSPSGGTKNVMRSLVRDLDAPVRECDITLPGGRNEELSFAQDDFVFFGFPVYGGRMPINIEKLFKGITGRNTPCALTVVYGNRAFDGALLDLHKVASQNGFVPIAGVAAIAEHSLAPQLATQRPDDQDRMKLAEWGKRILECASKGALLKSAPGAYPDWVFPPGMDPRPITDKGKCLNCGTCATVCPAGAIPADEPSLTNVEECIFCGACAKYCPEKARVMGNEAFHEFGKPHLVEAAKRKEPELFLELENA